MRLAPLASLALLVAGACVPAEIPPTATHRDSVGISIVESTAVDGEALPRWSVTGEPDVELGGNRDDVGHQLNGVVRAARLSDGRIVLGDGGTREVRFFGADGEYLRSVGGAGEGPGEFSRFLRGLELLPGDTIVASDWPFGTLTRFDSNGELLGTETIGPYLPGYVSRVLPDGAVLKDVYERRSYGNELEWRVAYGDEGLFRAPGAIIRHERGAAAADTLLAVLGEEYYKVGQWQEDQVFRLVPFGVKTLVSPAREHMYLAETGTPEIEVWSYDGELRKLIRFTAETVAVSALDREAVRDEVLAGDPPNRGDLERWLSAVPFPSHKPPVRELFAEPDGHLWVGLALESDATADPWIVFDPEGVATARIDLPSRFSPFDIGEEYVLGVWKDDLDVEFIRLYGLIR